MTVKKLSDADKNEILNLYRQTGETTSTLAERYGVSNSTISRFLKSTLAEDEYEELIQQKRAARTFGGARQTELFSEPEPDVSFAAPVEVETSLETAVGDADFKRVRLRSSAASNPETEMPATAQLPLFEAPSAIAVSNASPLDEDADREPVLRPRRLDSPASVGVSPSPLDEDSDAEQASAIAEMLGEDLLDDSEDLSDDEDEDLEDLDEDDLDEERPILKRRVPTQTLVQVLPLSAATLPKTCYLVIDRASELITRPLKDFGDLGQIPSQEVQQKTLPVFDNHRVARRFSTKRDRVIKIPDSRMLQKAHSQLQAKGITRLLVDGQVYSLSPT